MEGPVRDCCGWKAFAGITAAVTAISGAVTALENYLPPLISSRYSRLARDQIPAAPAKGQTSAARGGDPRG
jgi:hypothetical protein